MKKICSFILVYLIAGMVYSDGPPINDNDDIWVEYLSLNLTPEQVEKVGKERIVFLNEHQLEIIKKFTDNFPRELVIVTKSFPDCTCELLYGIWYRKNKIGIPLFQFDFPEFLESYSTYLNSIKEWDDFKINAKGEIYHQGKQVDLEYIRSYISKREKSSSENPTTVYFDRPPFINYNMSEYIDTVLDSLIDYSNKFNVHIHE